MAVAIGAGLARGHGWDWLFESTKGGIVPVLRPGRRPRRYDSLSVALVLGYSRLGKAERMAFDLLRSARRMCSSRLNDSGRISRHFYSSCMSGHCSYG